ncbi:hypothetical protein K8Q98_01995 [Candidatus Nomurabacteria bacterium]|nr:hypothetical protein [Candidatus Nomurabacteria bacterium]
MEIVKALKDSEKYALAKCIEQNWNKTVLAYSKELNSWHPKRPMEEELVLAFSKELNRLELGDLWKPDIIASIKKRRVLQTTPHLGVTEGPRFFCINWLGSLGVEDKDFYIVGMYSGIPFSNHTRPGRINRQKNSINLFPSTLQDGLVFRSLIHNKLVEIIDTTPRKLARLFPYPKAGESYTKWAIDSCQHIERKIFKKQNMVYLDINEVVSNYLVQFLRDESHVMNKIFFNQKYREEFEKIFPEEIMFYAPVMIGKYEKMASVPSPKWNTSLLTKKN